MNRGRPSGPKSRDGSFSSASRRRARDWASERAASTLPSEAEAWSWALDLVFLDMATLDLGILEE